MAPSLPAARETVMRMWYVVQVMRGREEAMAALIERVVPRELATECFFPRYVTEIKVRGAWVRVEKPLFPGYLIAVSDDAPELWAALRRLGEFAHLLTMDGVPVPLAPEEQELIGGFTKAGERVVPMSEAIKVGETVVITKGPLVGHEGLIREINRRKSTAYLEIDLCGRKVSTRVGIAVLSGAEGVDGHAAAVLEKAAEADRRASEERARQREEERREAERRGLTPKKTHKLATA